MPGVPRARRNTRRGLLGRIIGHYLPQGVLDRIGLSKGNGRETTFTRVWCLPGMDRVPACSPLPPLMCPSLYLRAMRWQRRDSLRVSVLITGKVPATGNHNVLGPGGAHLARPKAAVLSPERKARELIARRLRLRPNTFRSAERDSVQCAVRGIVGH